MKIISYTFLALLVLSLISCATSKSIVVDVKTPARVVFPADVANITIVDNSAQKEPSPKTDPTEYNVQNSKKTFFNALTQFINDEKFFSSASLDTIPLRNDSNLEDIHILNSYKVAQLIQKNQADAIITLDIYDIESNPAIIENNSGYYADFNAFYINAIMSIYGADGKKLTNTFGATSDTIYQPTMDNSPIDQTTINNMVMSIADNATKILLPYWQKQERVIFKTGTKSDELANAKIKENDWKGAALIWGEEYKIQKSNNKKSKLAANIALCNEMLADIDYAIEWINSSFQLYENGRTTYSETLLWYKNQLDERKKNFPTLQKQLTGSN